MAFDLVKLEMLQGALSILKQDKHAELGMCDALFRSCYHYLWRPADREFCGVGEMLPEIAAIISSSIINYRRCDGMYLWPVDRVAKEWRIAYLERLIEDEMSGTYFIQTFP